MIARHGKESRKLDALGATVPFVGWAPKSNRLLYSADDAVDSSKPMISIWEQGRTPVPIASFYENVIDISWSPDGDRIAWIHNANGTIHVHDSHTGGELRSYLAGHESNGQSLTWSPDGTRLASAGNEGNIKVWNLNAVSDEPERVFLGHQGSARWVAWADANTHLISGSSDKTIRIWPLDEVRSSSKEIKTPQPRSSVVWGPNDLIASGSEQFGNSEPTPAGIWNIESGERRQVSQAGCVPWTGTWKTA